MSQMKVWKIIKKRREQKAEAELEEAQRRDKAEEDLGRRLEEGNGQERAVWEAVYGDQEDSKKQQTDSGTGTDASESLRKGSLSAVGIREMRNSGSDSIEMSNLDAMGGSSRKASHDENPTEDKSRVTVRVASDDVPPFASTDHLASENRFSEISTGTSILDPAASMTKIVPSAELIATASNQRKDIPDKVQGSGPKVVPLPFNIPESSAGHDNDDVSSIATFAASEHFPQGSKRMSGSSLLRSFSRLSQHHSRNTSKSDEAPINPSIDEDRASSVAATVDDVSSDRSSDDEAASFAGKFTKSSKYSQDDLGEPNLMDSAIPADTAQGNHDQSADASGGGGATDITPTDPQTESFEPFKEGSFAGVKKPGKLPENLGFPEEQPEATKSQKSPAASEVSEPRSTPTKLHGYLPESASKVVMAYRTNEWAKHLDGAETPELDDLNSTNPPITNPETGEAPVPVRVVDLQQTPLTAEPAPMPIDRPPLPAANRSRTSVTKDSLHQNLQQPGSLRRQASGGNMERSSSQTSLQSIQNRRESQNSILTRLSSQTSLMTNRGIRSSSTPLVASPFVESPIEEGVESSFPARFTPSPLHLISHRENMVRNRISSTSLNRNTSSSSLSPIASPSTETSTPQVLPTLSEDLSLAARKSILQQDPSRSSLLLQQHPSRSSLALQQPNHSSASFQNPTRSASNPRESTLSAWRSSMRADLPTQQAAQQEIEARRLAMMHEKRRASTSQQWAQLESDKRESSMDKGMRRGELLDKHREAMRRMQSEANRKLG